MSRPGTKPSCQEVSILGSKTSNFFAKNFRYYFIDDITIHKLIGLSLLAVAAQLDLGMSKMVSFNYLNKGPWTTILWTAAKNIWSYCDPRYETPSGWYRGLVRSHVEGWFPYFKKQLYNYLKFWASFMMQLIFNLFQV